MKHATKKRAPVFRLALAILGLFAGLAMLQPTEIQAATSGGTTIFNEATVTYTTPSIPSTTAKGSTTVTVLSKAAAPFITVTPTAQTTGEGSTVTYAYNIINQSSGIADLAITTIPPTVVNAGVSVPTTNTLTTTAFPAMWGGIAAGFVSDGIASFPAGSLTGLANGDKVAVKVGLNVFYYTVAGTTPGTVPSSGVPEVLAQLTLTPVAYAGSPATIFNTANIGQAIAGTIIGEYGTTPHTLITGTASGASGTHTTNIGASANDGTTTATYTTTSAGDGNETITTVLKTPMSVVKAADKASAKPGETITYTIEVTNNTSEATTLASIADQLSTYVTYNTGSTTLNLVAVPDNGSAPFFPLSGAGISINTLGQIAGTILPGAANKASIVYQVTVN